MSTGEFSDIVLREPRETEVEPQNDQRKSTDRPRSSDWQEMRLWFNSFVNALSVIGLAVVLDPIVRSTTENTVAVMIGLTALFRLLHSVGRMRL